MGQGLQLEMLNLIDNTVGDTFELIGTEKGFLSTTLLRADYKC